MKCENCGATMTEVISEIDGYEFHICEKCGKKVKI